MTFLSQLFDILPVVSFILDLSKTTNIGLSAYVNTCLRKTFITEFIKKFILYKEIHCLKKFLCIGWSSVQIV